MDKDKKETLLLPACSCMTLTSKTGKHYWFRTCDIETDLWKEGAHVVQRTAGEEIIYSDGKREVNQYPYTGMTYNHQESWLLDGVNECGLTGGLLMLYEGTSVDKAEDGCGYIGMELVTKMLSSCRNVEEVITLAQEVRVLSIPYNHITVPATMHYFFADSSGNEVVLEATDLEQKGRLRIFRKEEVLGVMTNSPPYQEQLQNLAWFLSQSPELRQGLNGLAIRELVLDGRSIKADASARHLSINGTFPASYSSYDRFIRLTVLKALSDCGNHFEDHNMLALGSIIMNAVCEPYTKGVFHYTRMDEEGKIVGKKDSFTQYIVMYDIDKKCFHIKKYDEVVWKKYSL